MGLGITGYATKVMNKKCLYLSLFLFFSQFHLFWDTFLSLLLDDTKRSKRIRSSNLGNPPKNNILD